MSVLQLMALLPKDTADLKGSIAGPIDVEACMCSVC